MKKGDLSINIIIVAAISLIILVIIAVLIFGTGSQINRAKSCSGLGGMCISEGESCSDYNDAGTGETWVRHATAQCQDTEQFCCVKLN